MSDPKRATLITVGANKSAKSNVNKTVRLTVLLEESTNCKYPELNYKELVIAEEKKKHVQNGKTTGLDPFSDNDDDVERVARKFEQKYGGKSTYGKKGRSKQDDFADIGAGYDENDSFIDNTHGYDEMIPPECDTLYGGFYINSGSLEFKSVPLEQSNNSDEIAGKRNKRRISSSSSEEDSSESSSESSQDEKNPKTIANGSVDTHNTEHRKKKNKKADKAKPSKVRRTDSSAATSGKQTSDDNGHADAESVDCADSRTSHSDSVASKPAPSSENAVTSDSSRDVEAKVESKLPEGVVKVLEALVTAVGNQTSSQPAPTPKQLLAAHESLLLRLDEEVRACGDACVPRAAWARAAQALGVSRARLVQRVRAAACPAVSETATNDVASKRKHEDENLDFSDLTPEQREELIVETLQRLKDLIEERKPSMLAKYTDECKRVQEERKKLKIESGGGGPRVERRLPKRRFPWCERSRALLARLARLAPARLDAAALLARRVLPLFPYGFARMPTLLRQADLSKEIKMSDLKRQQLGLPLQTSVPQTQSQPPTITESIQFPSSLTVTTMHKTSPEKSEPVLTDDKEKSSTFGMILNSYTLNKEYKKENEDKPDDLYIPPNNIGSITITPVPSQKEKKSEKLCGLIRVKSPAALNDMVNKKDSKPTKKEKQPNSKRVESPLHIDTSYQPIKKDPSPKHSDGSQSSKKEPSPKTKDEVTQKQIECMRVGENNIPRPTLVPVHHSPTFAKPDKRPPEVKKKKDIIVVSDVDPLSDVPEVFDDSSSDVEVIETDKSDSIVPSKDKKSVKSVPKVKDGGLDDANDDTDIDILFRNLREMERRTNTSEQNGWS